MFTGFHFCRIHAIIRLGIYGTELPTSISDFHGAELMVYSQVWPLFGEPTSGENLNADMRISKQI
jgi:hypothetical protein